MRMCNTEQSTRTSEAAEPGLEEEPRKSVLERLGAMADVAPEPALVAKKPVNLGARCFSFGRAGCSNESGRSTLLSLLRSQDRGGVRSPIQARAYDG